MRSVHRTEQLVRSIILLSSCALLSSIAWLAGAYSLADQRWTYACIVGVVLVSAAVSRFGAKWLVRRIAERQAQNPSDPK